MSDTDYLTHRGKCKEMSEAAVAADPTLTLVRGHYFCTLWGEQAHWWCKRQDGIIVDPTKINSHRRATANMSSSTEWCSARSAARK
jgi:hypothetical protein